MLNLSEIYHIIFSYSHVHCAICLFTFLTSCFGDWGKSLRQRSFRRLLKSMESLYKRGADPHKQKLYATLNDGSTPLTILEVGIGDGVNFAFYPKSRTCNLIAVEPDGSCEKEIRAKLDGGEYGNIHLQNFYAISAEDMSPIPDGSVDVVMTTLAMCSIPSTMKTLGEIHRVLKPGGRYYFFEHTLDDPGTTWRRLQNFYLKTHIWQYGTGCSFFKPEVLFEFGGFSIIEPTKTRIAFSKSSFHPGNIVAPHYYGIATRVDLHLSSSPSISKPTAKGSRTDFEGPEHLTVV